jgi:putative heme-binding domain-containing protein
MFSKALLPASLLLSVFTIFSCKNKSAETTAAVETDTIYSGAKFNEHIRTTAARSPEEERLGFKLPEGFEITLYASEPDIGKPINFSFDAKGRMWVTQSYEYPFPAAPGNGHDRITILEDTNQDGKADKFSVFADTLNIPIGVLPTYDGVIGFSIPNVIHYADRNSDGKADTQRKIIGPFEHRDTHGMVNNFIRGFDGWIHACHGFTNRSTVAGSDGDSIKMISGNTFRFKPDGSRVEHTTYGRINPFGLAFDERGYLYSTDCHTSPLYQLIRGGDYYQWGKEEDMGFAPDMKPMEDEATALCGIAYYGDVLFQEKYRSNFYIGDAVSCRVYRNSYSFNASSPVGKKEENFVLSEDPWFRPVDVKMGPDGALYIADFYNSIIGHYEVPLDHPRRDKIRGRIWRITYKGKTTPVQNLSIAATEQLIAALNADNFNVRMSAADQLSDRIGMDAVAPLVAKLNAADASTRQKVHALWVLQRKDGLNDQLINRFLIDKDPMIRIHMMRILAERKDEEKKHYTHVLNALEDTDPHVQRAAVEVLQQYAEMQTIEKLIAFRKKVSATDNHMIYNVRLTLRTLLRNPALMHEVAAKTWPLDQAAVLATVLVGVHSNESGELLYSQLKAQAVEKAELSKTVTHITRFTNANALDQVIALAKLRAGDNTENEWNVFAAAQKGLSQRGAREPQLMEDWGKQIATAMLNAKKPDTKDQALLDRFDDQQEFAINIAGNYNMAELKPLLLKIAADTTAYVSNRIAAIRSLMKINEKDGIEIISESLLDPLATPDWRRRAVNLLSEFPGPATLALLNAVKHITPDLQQPLAMALIANSGGKELLFDKVRKGEIYSRILSQPQVEERILLNSTVKQKALLKELKSTVADISREKQTMINGRVSDFHSAKPAPSSSNGKLVFGKNCALCHSVNNEGGMIGPQLNGVGKWGVQALSEKILDPNRNISESFRTYSITLKDGKLLTGLFRREEGEIIVFADGSGKEFSVAKKDIKERAASKLTLMPDQFESTISPADYNDLLAYLLTLKS